MRLEAAFFSGSTPAASSSSSSARPRADLLVVDFDDTCTERDTIGPLLARVAEAADSGGGATKKTTGALPRAELVARLSAGYLERYQSLMAELLPSSPSPPPHTLSELLERLSDFDVEMNRVVERAGALAGVDAARAGAEVARSAGGGMVVPPGARLREGCARVLSRASELGVPVHVVSVNWSAKMVAAILQAGGVEAAVAAMAAPRSGSSNAGVTVVHANELAVGPDGLTTGTIDVTCECARDKARVFGELSSAAAAEAAADGPAAANNHGASPILSPAKGAKVDAAQSLERLRASASETEGGVTNGGGGAATTNGDGGSAPAPPPPPPPPPPAHTSAYVGDSLSDLPALLAADYGIVVGSNGTLRRVLAAYGIPLLPLVSAAAMAPPAERRQQQQVLFEAPGGWPEIEAFLFGPGPGASAVAALEQEQDAGAAAVGRTQDTNDGAATAPASTAAAAAALGRGVAVVAAAAAASADANDNSTASRGQQALLAAAVAAAQAAAPRRPPPPLVLTIAGSDSGGGAGVQADLKAFLSRGAFGMSCVTALTAQNTAGVASVHVPPTQVLEAQLDAVLDDLGAAAVKTGMLPNGETVRAVAAKLRRVAAACAAARRPAPALVVDPVLVTTSGHALASDGVASTLLRELFPLATVVTPNLDEAAVLLAAAAAAEASAGADGTGDVAASSSAPSGLFKSAQSGPVINSIEAMKDAAKRLHEAGRPRYVLLKGGHLAAAAFSSRAAAAERSNSGRPASSSSSPPPEAGLEAVDILYDGHEFVELRAPYVRTGNTHGTGCTLAAALAAELAHGRPVPQAAAQAKAYLTEALAASACLSFGGGPQRPFDHGTWLLRRAAVDELGGGMIGGEAGSTAAAAATFAAGRAAGSLQATGVLYNPCDLRVYAVTDPGLDQQQGRTVAQSVALAVAGGATVVQIRQKDCEGGRFLAAVRSALAVCRAAGVPLLVNDRVDVALAAGADGVHVGQADLPAAAVRRILGPRAIVGVSVKTPEEAVKAQADGADYLGCGAVFATGTKDSSVIGVEGLRAVCDAVDIPVVAIGGVGAANAEEVLLSARRRRRAVGDGGGSGDGATTTTMTGGCAGLAVVSAIFGKADARAAAEELRRAVESALGKREEIERRGQDCIV
jgi:hydroxymethylpyrimidine kinase / phosphomethylpyrimidine kinase / thiamine-phosphate diphosphorylase